MLAYSSSCYWKRSADSYRQKTELTITKEHPYCTRSNRELDSRKATRKSIRTTTNSSIKNEGTILNYGEVALLGVRSHSQGMIKMGICGVKVTC